MLQEAKKLLLAGIGAAAMTYDKSMEVINQLVEKGKLTVEDGKELSDELKKDIKAKAELAKCKAELAKNKANDKLHEMKPLTKEDITEVLKSLNFVTKEEFEALKTKIANLEKLLEKTE